MSNINKSDDTFDKKFNSLVARKNIFAAISKYSIEEYFGNVSQKEVRNLINSNDDSDTIPINQTVNSKGAKIEYDSIADVSLPKDLQTEDFKEIGIRINLEMQRNSSPVYNLHKREVYYVSRMIDDMLESTANPKEYDKIKPVYGIWIILTKNDKLKDNVVKYNLSSNDYMSKFDKNGQISYINIYKIYIDSRYAEKEVSDLAPDIVKLIYGLFKNNKGLLENLEIEYNKSDEERIDSMVEERSLIYEDGFADGESEGKAEGFFIAYLQNEVSQTDIMWILNITKEEFDTLVDKYKDF